MNKKILVVLYFIITVLILAGPAFYNCYPLVFSDSGTYITSSLNLKPPIDRPIGYGFFIRAITWKASLWPVVIGQSLLLSVLLFKAMRLFLKRAVCYYLHFTMVLILTLFTGAGWYASQIMPDGMTPILILSLLLLFYANGKWEKIIYGGVVFGSLITHFSHFPILGMLLVLVLAFSYFQKGRFQEAETIFKNSWIALGILVISFLFLSSYNYQHTGKFEFSRSSHVFLMGRLNEMGMVKSYLNQNCEQKNYNLCDYKDSLPKKAATFVWNKNSPLHKMGGFKSTKKEYNAIIYDMLTRPKYMGWFLWEVFTGTFKQLLNISIGSGLSPYKENSPPFWPIESDFEEELNYFLISKQAKDQLDFFPYINMIHYVLMGFSVAVILFQFPFKHNYSRLQFFLGVIVLSVVLHAAVVSSLANVYDRLQARIMWLIPFLALLILFSKNQLPFLKKLKKIRQ